MSEVLEIADIYVIDLPSTSLAFVAATNKPILFFDTQLKKLVPEALHDIRSRCHYTSVDILYPENSFAEMEADLSKKTAHSFVPKYCLTDDPHQDEVSAVADVIVSVLA